MHDDTQATTAIWDMTDEEIQRAPLDEASVRISDAAIGEVLACLASDLSTTSENTDSDKDR